MVIAPLLALILVVGLMDLPNTLNVFPQWVGNALGCFLLGWGARSWFRLRAPFLPATLVAVGIVVVMGVDFMEGLQFGILFIGLSWAGFFMPFPARSKGLWDISMPWIAQAPVLVTTVSIAVSLGSLWILDGIHLDWVDRSDRRIMEVARSFYFNAFAESIEDEMEYMRLDDRDFSASRTGPGGFYVRKGEIVLDDEDSDTLLMIFDKGKIIGRRGRLFPRNKPYMHIGVNFGGSLLLLGVEEFEALDLSDFVYRPL